MSDENPNPTPPKRPTRWLKPVLFLSLATNLLIIGVVAGSMLSPEGPRKRGNEDRAIRGVLGEPFLRALPSEQRRALVRDVVRERETLREGRNTVRERLERFLATLRADDFDRAEAKRLLGEQRGAIERLRTTGEGMLLDRLEAMTAEERAAYADVLEDHLMGNRKR